MDLQYRLHFEFVLSMGSKSKGGRKKSARTQSSSSTSSELQQNAEDVAPEDQGGPYDCGAFETLEDGTELWRAPHQLEIETLVWDLPVHISPSPPHHLAVALNLPQSFASTTVWKVFCVYKVRFLNFKSDFF